MADYYPLLARALKALPDPNEATRRAVYERARGALIGQLRSLEPPLSEADIDHERVALDAAIARLEEEHGGAPAPAPAPPPPPEPPPPALPPAPPLAVPEPPPPVETPPLARDPEPEPLPTPVALPEADPPPAAVSPGAASAPPLSEPSLAPASPDPADRPSAPPVIVPARPRSRAVAEAPRPEGEAADAARAQRPRIEIRPARASRGRLLRNLAVAAVLLMVLGLIAATAWALRDRPSDLVASAPGVGTARPAESDAAKYGDRVGGERAPAAASAPGAAPRPAVTAPTPQPSIAVAQRATLYEENPAEPQAQPKATTGRAVWRLDAVNGGQGQPLETVVRASVEVPGAGGLTLAITIRRNTDATFPASHTIELAFSGTGGEPNRTVRDIGLLQLKEEENGRGTALAGLPVPVRDNLFLIGLSSLPTELQRNADLLQSRNWIDLPIRYVGGGRAVLTFERGTAGERVLKDAFAQWQ